MQQRTLKTAIQAVGVGLHSGQKVQLTLLPAPIHTGIVYRRTDVFPAIEIPASAQLVTETTLCTGLTDRNANVRTVEHLMSALAGMGIDNLIIEVSTAEMPIFDGSSSPFIFLLQSAGILLQEAPKRFVEILRPIEVRDGDKLARLVPYDGFALDFTIAFDHPMIPPKYSHHHLDFTTESYIQTISRARTFGFMRDLEYMRELNLALGGSMDNAIVLDEFRVLNADGLRFHDEFVRHKILDAIGDLYLVGGPVIGAFEGYKSGHRLNNQLARALLADTSAWQWQTFSDAGRPSPIQYQGASAI